MYTPLIGTATGTIYVAKIMAVLKFTLSEDGVNVLRDGLACLGKFSDEVSLEAKRDRVCLQSACVYFVPLAEAPFSLPSWF
jgi:hypothetical protein